MSSVNYGESVIIPVLQKKVQELQNANLVLEVNLLVEQARSKDISEKIAENESSLRSCNDQLDGEITRATSFAHEANQLRSEVSTMTARVTALENDLRRETSIKESVLAEYKTLKQSYDLLAVELEAAKARISELEAPPQAEKTAKKASKAVANG